MARSVYLVCVFIFQGAAPAAAATLDAPIELVHHHCMRSAEATLYSGSVLLSLCSPAAII